MEQSVCLTIAVVSLLLFVPVAVILLRLWREHKKLRQAFQAVSAQLQRSNNDVIGLCAAAVELDKRLALYESRLSDALERTDSRTQTPSTPAIDDLMEIDDAGDDQDAHGYELAIEKIRQGANAEELVKSCGLTHDEAELLMRLHGKH
ncbi:MAG: DUF2802 domain-containing protein [Gammaproteobacteria bacterium]